MLLLGLVCRVSNEWKRERMERRECGQRESEAKCKSGKCMKQRYD